MCVFFFSFVQMNRAWVNLSKAPIGSVKSKIHGYAFFYFFLCLVCHEYCSCDWRGRLNEGVIDC